MAKIRVRTSVRAAIYGRDQPAPAGEQILAELGRLVDADFSTLKREHREIACALVKVLERRTDVGFQC